MLKTVFDWLDRYPHSYWFIAIVPSLWLFCRALLQVKRDIHGRASPTPTAPWVDAMALFAFLLAWRWPFLLIAHDYNPDESQLIAGALTLTHDPVFWRSVDGTTSGPLNFYALLPLHALGLPFDYFTARLTGLLLVWAALFACQRALSKTFGVTAGWLGILPAASFFATVTHSDLTHYSSEHLSLLLIALACWLLQTREAGDRVRLWSALFVAGMAPWAKLQSVPISLVLIGWGCFQVLRTESHAKTRARSIAAAGLASLLPSLLAWILILAAGQADAAIRRYFLNNLIYVGHDVERTLSDALAQMYGLAMIDGRFPLLVITVVPIILAASIACLFRRVRPSQAFVVGAILTMAAAAAIVVPRREFLHYVLLLPVPLTFCFGAAIGDWWNRLPSIRARWALASLLIAGGGVPLATRISQPVPDIFGDFGDQWRHPQSRESMLVHALAGPVGCLAIWGWEPALYVETGLRQATRDAHTVWSIQPSPLRDYHRSHYLADLQSNRPPVFVDAVGPGAFAFEHRQVQAHEIFPELAEFVRNNYTLVRDLNSMRIYARNDLPALREMSASRVERILALGRDAKTAFPPALTPIDRLTPKVIDSRPVKMILPPSLVEWRLDGDVRKVSLEFGFDPEAYERGHSNGAEVVLELSNLEQTRQIFSRFLDPARRKEDRGPQNAQITLPPFGSGTHLILRTTAGPNGDNAWDWLYFSHLKLHRHPSFLPQQFPSFNRVPDFIRADNSGVIDEESGPVFQLHAPGELAFALTGREAQLSLIYGFRAGAHSDGGLTDGAIYRVEIVRAGEPNRLIFEHHLQPVHREADRGRQTAKILLTKIQPDDRLVLTTDSGPGRNAAWDWTCIYQFTLE